MQAKVFRNEISKISKPLPIKVAEIIPQKWDRICVLTPRSVNYDFNEKSLKGILDNEISSIDEEEIEKFTDGHSFFLILISHGKVTEILSFLNRPFIYEGKEYPLVFSHQINNKKSNCYSSSTVSLSFREKKGVTKILYFTDGEE